jgi:hypothetical protein
MELVETLFSKSAREQMKQSRNGYKLSKFVQKIFADLFGDAGAEYLDEEEAICLFLAQ